MTAERMWAEIEYMMKCEGCNKPFLFTTNPNLVGGLGLRIYELIGEDEYYYPDAELLYCKQCTEDWVESCEVADSRGQGQVGYE